MNDDKIKIENVGTTSVIFVKGVKGDGTRENPCRDVTQFYTSSGIFIGEIVNLTVTDINNLQGIIIDRFGKNKISIFAVDEFQKKNTELKKQLEELRFQVGANLETVRWLIQKTHELLSEQNSHEVKDE